MKLLTKKRVRGPLCGAFICAIISLPAIADTSCDSEVDSINAAIASPAPGVTAGDIEQAQIMVESVTAQCESGATLASVENEVNAIKHMLRME